MRRGVQPRELEMPAHPREVAVLHVDDFQNLVEQGESEALADEAGDTLLRAGAGSSAAAGGGERYLLVFTVVASIGGLLFGFDTGVISGALPYIRDDILQQYAGDAAALAHWQELIVSSAIVAAGVGSVAGGWLSDRLGRRTALLVADVLFTLGAVAMAAAQDQYWLIAGRAMVGLGVGLASVTVPIYIAECAPPARRASLVTMNVVFITGGQFVAYVADYVFSFVPGTWRWMLGVAALPSLLQLGGLLLLPESPRWLASKGRAVAAQRALQKLQPGAAGAVAAAALAGPAAPTVAGSDGMVVGAAAAAADISGSSGGSSSSVELKLPSQEQANGWQQQWRLLRSPPVLRALHVGVGLQVLQQVAGINTVMYYTPSILQLAGVQKQAALLLSMVPAATNALGTVVGMRAIDRCGRRRLLLTSIAAVVAALAALGSAFLAAERHSPAVLPGAQGSTCVAGSPLLPDCTACLRAGCGFCGAAGAGTADLMAPGTCLALDQQAAAAAGGAACPADGKHQLYLHGCPSHFSWLILGCLIAYLAAFSPGLGPVPWAVNAEIYPLAVRGLATGLAATSNWISNALVAQTFLTLTNRLGGSGAFYLYAAIASAGFLWTYAVLPETNGLSLEQVQQLFGGDPSTGGSRSYGSSGGGLLWSRRERERERKRRGSDDGMQEEGLVAATAGVGG